MQDTVVVTAQVRSARKSPLLWGAVLFSASMVAAPAQTLEPDATEAAARVALAVLGIAATPNETLSSLSVVSTSGDNSSFRSTQLRGGFNLLDSPLYLEGLIAYQRYNPTFIFPGVSPDVELDVTWESVAGTVGVGWDFPLGGDWRLRPIGHLSLGQVATDADVVGRPPMPLGMRAAQAVDGTLNSYGVGASLALVRDATFGKWEGEYRLRQTYLEFPPLNEPQAGDAKASSNQTTLFARHRYPLEGFRPLDLPSNLILDAGVVFYRGDGEAVLQTNWVATAGIGLELETEESSLLGGLAGRVMLSGVVSQEFDGLSIGFGLRF